MEFNVLVLCYEGHIRGTPKSVIVRGRWVYTIEGVYMDQNNSHWPFKSNKPNFEFELILWKLETLHVNYYFIHFMSCLYLLILRCDKFFTICRNFHYIGLDKLRWQILKLNWTVAHTKSNYFFSLEKLENTLYRIKQYRY